MIQAEKRDALIQFLRKKIETRFIIQNQYIYKAGVNFKRKKLENTEFFAKNIKFTNKPHLSKNDIIKICNNIKRFYAII